MLILSLLVSARAAEPGFGIRLAGELLQDQNITVSYGGSSLSGEGLLILPLTERLELGATVGYRRLSGSLTLEGVETGESTWLWYAPIQATIGGRMPVNSLFLYGAIGPSFIFWGEAIPQDLAIGIGTSGGKFGLGGEVGINVPLQLQQSLHDPDAGPSGLEVNIGLGYRYAFRSSNGCLSDPPCGLDFSALRLSAGLVLRL